jgi:hypothetical protein
LTNLTDTSKLRAMFLITHDNDPLALVNKYDQDDDGLWIWMGHFAGAEATPLVSGTVIPQWVLWTRGENHDRTDLEVLKVNRVTISVRAKDDGSVHTIRIDR